MKRLTIGARACTEILALLISVAWADERLEDREKASVRAAANVFNLPKELRDRLETALASALPLDQILVESLSPHDRAFAYVASVWLTGVDEDVDPREQDLCDRIAERVGISKERKTELQAIARDLLAAHKSDGEQSWADHLVTLFKAIPPRLEGSDEPIELVIE